MKTDNKSARVGATVVLAFAGDHYASGEIVRRLESECGVQFHRPLSTVVIDHIAAQLD